MIIKKIVEERIDYLFKEYFDEASREGVIFLTFKVKSKSKDTAKGLQRELRAVYKTLKFSCVFEESIDSWRVVVGIKAILGEELDLANIVSLIINMNLDLIIRESKIYDSEKFSKEYIKIFKRNFLAGKSIDLIFAKNDNSITILASILDKILLPLSMDNTEYFKNIKTDFFVQENWVQKYKPIISSRRKEKIINLIRFDFAINNRIIRNTSLYRIDIDGNYTFFCSIEEYIYSLPELFKNLKEEYYMHLLKVDIDNLLLDMEDTVKGIFNNIYFLPRDYSINDKIN